MHGTQRTFPAAERMYAIVNGCSTCIPSACSVHRFGPPRRLCRSFVVRHRQTLVDLASPNVQHMQKALDQMNLQLHHVFSDLRATGLAIVMRSLRANVTFIN